jgi:curli biogenesis system outer membrane secretion channel CsgG
MMTKTFFMCWRVLIIIVQFFPGAISGHSNRSQLSDSEHFTLMSLVSYASRPAKSSDHLNEKLVELTRQVVSAMTENRKRNIAVIEFEDLKKKVTDFGTFLSEELTTRLVQTRKFKVMERQLLNKIITEQKLVLTGAFDPSSAQRLGRLYGVEAICSGSITELARSLRVNGRLISTETGEIFAGVSVEITKDESVLQLLGRNSSGSSGLDNPRNSSRTQDPPLTRTVKSNLFTFELQQCIQSGTTVICDFIVTNQDDDKWFTFGGGVNSQLFDNFGNEAKINLARIANQSGRQDARILIVSGVPTKARMGFEGISAQATKISLLKFQCAFNDKSGYREFNVQFKDVPLTK